MSRMSGNSALVWYRRDLRLTDHAALSRALDASSAVYCVFCFDTEILDPLPSRTDRRVEFIWHTVQELDRALAERGGGLIVLHGRAREEVPRLAVALGVATVYANRDYEPAARERDADVREALEARGIGFESFKDQVIFERDELLTGARTPYSVFTAYKNAWLRQLSPADLAAHPAERGTGNLARPPAGRIPTLDDLGFRRTNLTELPIPTGMSGARALFDAFIERIGQYHERRDFPALHGPSYLSVHLRFGTISVRELAGRARAIGGRGAETWLTELVWRDFYFMILHHHPHVVGHAFKRELEDVEFENDPERFAAWCEARTGYPLVDAAMRQINRTGYMHNRLRMVVASFLVKDLLVDWRWGERYFADHLIDFDLAANNGGWQWAASTGCDAQPYFRIFNPVTQSEKFDPDGRFIRHYVPELAKIPDRYIHAPWRMSPAEQSVCGCVIGRDYPPPVVDHAVSRKATLERYERARRPGARG
ncbi:MAG: deoxyribodipyrimidine photo-lyase [Burkholderiales bacterium]